MKKFFLNPGFEFIFSLGLIAILGLPPVLLAQNQKEVEIKIENGDTTVNGKNIKELSAKDRENALKDIKHLNGGNKPAPKYRAYNEAPDKMELEGRTRKLIVRSERKNSQNFDYVNTDNEGISTHVRFHASEISNEDLKKMPHIEGAKFEISDLNIVPEFSTGKTLLMFNLPAKTPAEVKFLDSEGKIIWNEKSTGGSFNKTFVLGLNGIYYLQIKQGRNVCIKKIVKEE